MQPDWTITATWLSASDSHTPEKHTSAGSLAPGTELMPPSPPTLRVADNHTAGIFNLSCTWESLGCFSELVPQASETWVWPRRKPLPQSHSQASDSPSAALQVTTMLVHRGPDTGPWAPPGQDSTAGLTIREASSSSSRLACCTPCGSPSMRIRLLFSLSGGMRTDTLYWSLILFT